MDRRKFIGEIWTPILGFEDRYFISTGGRVKSIDMRTRARNGSIKLQKGRILSLTKNARGYYRVALGRNQNFKTKEVHRLVALNFIPNPENKKWVNHKDGIKTNNHVDNLQWTTPSENNQHAQDNLLNKSRFSNKQKIAARKNGFKKGHIPWNKIEKGG